MVHVMIHLTDVSAMIIHAFDNPFAVSSKDSFDNPFV